MLSLFNAAVDSGHQLMFTYGDNKITMDVLNVADCKDEFKEDSRGFIALHGAKWYFCHIDSSPI